MIFLIKESKMNSLTDKQMEQMLDLQIAARVTKRKSRKMSLKAESHLDTAKKLIEKKKHEAAKLHCCQSLKYEDLSRRSLQRSMEIELVLDICKSTIETGRTTESLSKLIQETARPFALAFENDLEADIDDLTLRNNLLGVKLGDSSLHTIDATPLYDQLLHQHALNAVEDMPEIPTGLNMESTSDSVKHHN